MMKIVMPVIRYHPATGGVEQVAKCQAEELVRRGHQVTIVTSDLAQHQQLVRLMVPSRAMINGVAVRRFPAYYPPRWPYPVIPGLLRELLSMERYDIVHAHSFWYWPALAARLAAAGRGIPLVLQPHYDDKRGRWNYCYRKCLGPFLMRADCIVAVSAFEQKLLAARGLTSRNICLLGNGIELKKYSSPAEDIFRTYPQCRGKQVCLFVGRLDAGKGVDLLLRATALLTKTVPDQVCFLVGEDFGARGELRRLAEELGIADRVVFAGCLPEEQLLAAYRHAACLVLPSRYEAFGVVLIEAMASRTPVIGMAMAAIPDLVRDGETGWLFAPEDAAGLAANISRVLREPDEALRRAENARRMVRQKYTWEKIVNELEEIYRALRRMRANG